MWSKLRVDPLELNLAAVLRCGQSFRWRQSVKDEATWSICMQNRVLFVRQDTAHLYYRSEGPGNTTSDLDLVQDYFNLKIGLRELYEQWIEKDAKHFKSVHLGVRILRQDPWETLCAFICSSNNNIKRISKMVHSLCTEFGTHVATIDGQSYYDFPTPAQLLTEETEARLRALGFGYRAKYIARTAELMHAKRADYLNSLRLADADTAVAALLEFAGVGPKVADCVSLMSLDKHEIVPIDTHMYQIASRDYKMKATQGAKGYKDVQLRFRETWGDYAGWAHSVLFAGDLPDLQTISKRVHEDADTQMSVKRTKLETTVQVSNILPPSTVLAISPAPPSVVVNRDSNAKIKSEADRELNEHRGHLAVKVEA